MTSRVLAMGHGAAGAVAYITHDEGHASTRKRVCGIAVRGFPVTVHVSASSESRLAAQEALLGRVLQATAADGPALKRLAGISNRGRKCRSPIAHIGLSWPAGQRPTWDEMQAAGDSWLTANGLEEHRAVMAGHVEDGKPAHLHVVICVVHPETGRVHKGNLALGGSRWAEEWERSHGGIVIPTRVKRNAARAVAREAHEKGDHEAARAALSRMPATEATRSNGRGHTPPAHKPHWTALYDRQRTDMAALRERLAAEEASQREKNRRLRERQRAHEAEQRAFAAWLKAGNADQVPDQPTATVDVPDGPDEQQPAAVEPDERVAAHEPAEQAAQPAPAAVRLAQLELAAWVDREWPAGVPLGTKSLTGLAEGLRDGGDAVDRLAAAALEATAAKRSTAERERAARDEERLSRAAWQALVEMIIAELHAICRRILQPEPGRTARTAASQADHQDRGRAPAR